MSNPDQLHLIAVGGVPLTPGASPMLHTYRNDQGQWQGFMGNVNQQCGNSQQYFPVIVCTGVGASLQVCGVDSQDKNIYHTIREAGGGWQGDFGNVNGQNSGGTSIGLRPDRVCRDRVKWSPPSVCSTSQWRKHLPYVAES